ncbi:hypothetical protein ACIHFE_06195 [Streptomyces sp. NPDC052396]|uniref:hypothetical protein n=1 Tax=Streptomyces sp. NPDC052396 TaxID=3365689 RepID=UPI0037D4A3A8
MSCTLPSRTPGYHFEAYLTGAWQDLPGRHQHQNPHDAAASHALTVAQGITGELQLSREAAAQAAINSRLGQPVEVPGAPVRLLWARIQLTADPQQAAHVNRLLREQHNAERRARDDQHRLQRAQDLREALLSDPSLAFAYWFLDHPEAIDTETVQRVEKLVASAASYAPRNTWVQVAALLQDFVRNLPDDARRHLVTGLAHIFDRYGQPERARSLRALSDEMAPPPPPSSDPILADSHE